MQQHRHQHYPKRLQLHQMVFRTIFPFLHEPYTFIHSAPYSFILYICLNVCFHFSSMNLATLHVTPRPWAKTERRVGSEWSLSLTFIGGSLIIPDWRAMAAIIRRSQVECHDTYCIVPQWIYVFSEKKKVEWNNTETNHLFLALTVSEATVAHDEEQAWWNSRGVCWPVTWTVWWVTLHLTLASCFIGNTLWLLTLILISQNKDKHDFLYFTFFCNLVPCKDQNSK